METITFKAPIGTKAKLRELSANISEFLRQATENLVAGRKRSAYERAKHLMFHGGGNYVDTFHD